MALMTKMKGKVTDLVSSATQAPEETSTPRDERMVYGGFAQDKNGGVLGLAATAPHLLWLAGTGSGKTRRGLVPQVCIWEGPVFAVSAKSDVAEYSAHIRRERFGGPIYMMDLTGQADWSALPDDIIPVSNDPCRLLVPDENGSTDDSALGLAELLTSVGSLGMGGGGGGGDSAFWMTLAVGPLACLLQAGAGYLDPDTDEWVDGGGIEWVRKAALNPGVTDQDDDDLDPAELDLDTPSWDVAAARAESIKSGHVAELESAKELDPKQRDSVGINLRVALSSWNRRAVRNAKADVSFTPELLEDPNATFYLVSPSKGGASGAASATVDSLVEHWTLHAMTKKLPKIAMVIDECPSICKLPRLDEYISVMRSYGMHFLVAAQDSSQFVEKFGKAKSDVLLNIFPAIMIGVGALEKDLIERAAWSQLPSERRAASNDDHGKENLSSDRTRAHEGSELLPRHQGEGRPLLRGMSGQKVKLVDFSQM